MAATSSPSRSRRHVSRSACWWYWSSSAHPGAAHLPSPKPSLTRPKGSPLSYPASRTGSLEFTGNHADDEVSGAGSVLQLRLVVTAPDYDEALHFYRDV